MQTLISPLASAATAFVATLGGLALKAGLLLALAWIATRFMRRSPAALRHSVWTAAIAGAMILPLLALALPKLRAPIPGAAAVEDLAARIAATPSQRVLNVRDVEPVPAPTPTVVARISGDTDDPAMVMAGAAAAAASVSSGPVDVRLEAARPDLPLGATLVLLWIIGTTLALVPMALGVAHLRRIANRVHDVESDALDDYASRLARTLGVRRVVRVVEGAVGATPMTWGVFRPVVMVPGGFNEWSEEQQRDVLLHELAHVARYDCLTQHLARFVCALYWFNPLAWVAATRLRIERERACDDRVLLAGARPSAYADHLLTIARTLRGPGLASAAALAMARPSHLEGRLLALLDAGRRRGTVTRRAAATVASAVLAVAALLAMIAPGAARTANAAEPDAGPLFLSHALPQSTDTIPPKAAEPPATPPPATTEGSTSSTTSSSSTRTSKVGTTVAEKPLFNLAWCNPGTSNSSSSQVWTDDEDDRMRATIKRGRCVVQLETEGEVTYNDDFTDVVGLARGGSFEIYDKGGAVAHSLRIVRASNGTLVRTWKVDGVEQPYDAEAQKWLQERMEVLDQNTDFSKGARINAVYKSKGANGVIDLVSLSQSDYAKRVGVGRLLKLAQLDEAQVGRIIDLAKTTMKSDYEQSELLRGLLAEKLVTPALQVRYIDAASAMSSDYERSRTLKAIVDDGVLTTAAQKAVYGIASKISSDYERGQLMKAVTKQYGLGGETWRSFVDAASRFSSDYELRTMLTSAVNDYPKLPDATIEAILDLVKTKIDSDYEKAEFFITVARARPATEAEHERIAKAAESISSEYEYGRVLAALRKRRVTSGNL